MNPIICRDSRVTSQWLRPKLLSWDPNIGKLTHDPSDSRFAEYNYWWVEFWSASRLLNQWIITYSERKTQLDSVYQRSGEFVQGWPAKVCLRLQKDQTYGPADMLDGFIPPSTPPAPEFNNFRIIELEFKTNRIVVYWDPFDFSNPAYVKASLFKQEGGIWKKFLFSSLYFSRGEINLLHNLPAQTDVLLTASLFYNQENWVQDEKLVKLPNVPQMPNFELTNYVFTRQYLVVEWDSNAHPNLKIAIRPYIWLSNNGWTPIMAKRKTIVNAWEGSFYWEHGLPSGTFLLIICYYVNPNDNRLRGSEDGVSSYVP
jgi:hypothetical protein